MKYKRYSKDIEYSYAFGAYPTFELIKNKPHSCIEVLTSGKLNVDKSTNELIKLCSKNGINITMDDKTLSRISPKENIYVVGVFKKYESALEGSQPHIILDNPGNMGNTGTILRTSLGFGIRNVAIIKPGVDVFDPKTVRASMGAAFSMNIEYFDTINKYIENFTTHDIYTFMLNGKCRIGDIKSKGLYSLVFGNEAEGLPPHYSNIGTSVVIPHENDIDSLNITVAVGIAENHFYTIREN